MEITGSDDFVLIREVDLYLDIGGACRGFFFCLHAHDQAGFVVVVVVVVVVGFITLSTPPPQCAVCIQ